MKFISKNQNLCVILKSGTPANRLTGQEYVPSLSVKFQQGILIVPDDNEETLRLLKGHNGFSTDFICADEQPDPEKDPYAHQRASNEPEHSITAIEPGGIIGKSISGPRKIKLTPEMTKLIEGMATQMALKIAPKMAAELVERLASVEKQDTPQQVQPADEENAILAEELVPTEKEIVPEAPLVSPFEENSPFTEELAPPNEPSRVPLDESKLPQPMEAPKPKVSTQKKTTTKRKVSTIKKINKVQEPEVIQTEIKDGEDKK